MKIGYARVSTKEQSLLMQTEDLLKYGCEKVFEEKVSSVRERPELERLLNSIRENDVLVVWKLDRLGRSLKQLINIVDDLRNRNIGFVSLQDNIDTTSSQGRLFFNLIASFSEFEREIIKERTKAGLEAAKRMGRTGGRKKGLSLEATKRAKIGKALYLQKNPKLSVTEICDAAGIKSKATLYRYLRYMGVEI